MSRSWVRKILFLLAAFTSVALIISALASYIDPQTFILPAFFGLAFPFIMLLHIACCILYFIASRSRLVLWFIVPLLVSANIFTNSFGVHFFASAKPNAEGAFSFMTYNVHNFADRIKKEVSIIPGIMQVVREESPDIICFQDYFCHLKKISVPDSIKSILHTQYFYTGPDTVKLFPQNALAIFSKFPIVNHGYIRLSDLSSGNQCIFADIRKGNRIFRVYNVHLQSLKFQREDFEKWDRGTRSKVSFLTHNIRRLHYAFLERSRQVKIMKKETASCAIPYIIAGDFNDSPSSFAVNEMCRGLQNTFREKGTGYEVTYNGDLPNFQIDYVMARPEFKINSYKVIKKKLSDHYGVKVGMSF